MDGEGMSEKWTRARGADSGFFPDENGAAWSPTRRVLGPHPGLASGYHDQ